MPKIRPAQRFWRTHQQSTCRDQWCESGMRQKDPNTPASYTWNQENHWKSYFFNSVFKWNCIWVTSEKFGSGWGTGLQSVLNRPTKRLEPASNQRSSRKSQRCMPGSASPHSAACPRPPKKVVFWRQSTNFPLLHLGNGHISKTRTKTQLVSFWTDMAKT